MVEPAEEEGDVLPEPMPELLPPPEGDRPEHERLYFDPEKWDAEAAEQPWPGDADPVATSRGLVEGQSRGVLFLSDMHIADGTAAGDDFLESHLRANDELGGLQVGFFPPGASRAGLFLSVLTFSLRRLSERLGADAAVDVVLNGDVLNFLEMKGRGGTYVSRRHIPFFRALAALPKRCVSYWLRGNHDYIVPSGPWRPGEFYVNRTLRVLAEHGDFWDKENWPPGLNNKGSRLVLEAGSAFEVHPDQDKQGALRYLMSGLDNLRPWSNPAIEGFLDRRSKYSDAATLATTLARIKFLGAADDSAAYKGALQRRKGAHADYLMVQGHTHVPAIAPGVYYNLGTWVTSLVAVGGKEKQIEAFPFLLVYADNSGQRVEEYYMAQRSSAAAAPRAVLQTVESVQRLREAFGYGNKIP